MTGHTTYTNSEEFRNVLRELVGSLLSKYKQTSLAVTSGLQPLDRNTIHFIGKLLQQGQSPLEKTICKLLGQCLVRVESLSGGSAPLAFLYMLVFVENLLQTEIWGVEGPQITTKAYEEAIEDIGRAVRRVSTNPVEDDLRGLVQRACGNDNIITTVAMEALKLAGMEGKIYLETGKQPNYVIERKSGYVFKTKPFRFFLDPSSSLWEAQNVKILLVDGVIERVSEIDALLNSACSHKQPGVFIARGFSEEVLGTLKTNMDQGLLRIIPVRIGSDLESVNILNDIASVAGTDIVSTLKGDMLCYKKWEDLPGVQKAKCLPDQIIIEETRTRAQVSTQLQHLVNKRINNQNIEDVVNIIDGRIKSLMSDAVYLRLPSMTGVEEQAVRTKLDISLRTAKTALNYNMINLADLVSQKEIQMCSLDSTVKACAYRALKTATEFLGQDKTGCLSVHLAIQVAGRQALMLALCNGIVSEEPTQL